VSADAKSEIGDHIPPIADTDPHVLRARRTAALTRATLGAMGIALILADGSLFTHPSIAIAGIAVISLGLLLTSGRLTRELNHLLHQARYDADHDDLTGLLSYAAFRATLKQTVERSERSAPVSLLLLDLERFGVVNKSHGHAAGDALLAAVGERLLAVAGRERPVGRLGGDEFAVISGGSDSLVLAEALLAALPGRSEDDPRPISACVGISQTPADGDSGEALLRAADIALRVAKRSGLTGQISAYTGGSLSGTGERSARGTLDRLIEGKGLSMAVQPIVDPRSGAIHAYEALARFGRRSTDSPLHWLAVAEEFGERDRLERACLRAALELFVSRPRDVLLSVNLSAPVLLDRRTLDLLDRPADLSGLIVEVTEEALVQSESQLQQTMRPLLARGAKLAVDDMGAGYSGLRQITTVHPSYLKLDRSLIAGIDEDSDRQALVGALVGYATHVGSLLVAEGIETAAELSALIELGVPLVQGFYLGRPAAPWPRVAVGQLATPA
jgi:diguanylate cyclase (GGDEF)-like protein